MYSTPIPVSPKDYSGEPSVSLILDAVADKEKAMQSITAAVIVQRPHANHALVERLVHAKYEDLLSQAVVTKHISALVEGIVRRQV